LQENGYNGQNAFAKLEEAITIAGGLSLSQVCSITGLEQSTVQNWVKRGWVARPERKRYTELQLARIMLINMLRASLRLEQIAGLMRYINGSVEDRSDDIIAEKELYNRLCYILFKIGNTDYISANEISKIVKEELATYQPAYDGAKEKLENALVIMTTAYYSAWMLKKTSELMDLIKIREE
jgi:DNA-binding transcriptional MerR regulator